MIDPTLRRRRRAAAASFIGTCIEWYDFYVFSVAASLVFGQVFFPLSDPIAALSASFATYAVGFFARPLGAMIFGSIGDRLGRQRALVLTLTLMGGATVLTGLLPAYDQIGPWAPVLLVTLRVVQGVATGGEWGGAVLISVEHAPERSKAFYGGFTQLGNPAGAMLATGVFSAMTALGDEALMTWAWRIPFLLSAILIVVGMVIRARVEESPVFEAAPPSRRPIADTLGRHWRVLLLAIGMVAVPTGGYYLTTTYFTAYATEDVGLDPTFVLNVLSIGSLVELLATMPCAWLADRLGRVRVLVAGVVGLGVFGAAMFFVVGLQSEWLLIAIFVVLRIAGCGAYAALAGVMAQMFPAEARYTSISLGYQVGAAVFGGLSPLIATLLVGATGSVWAVVGFLAVLCAISAACSLAAPQRIDDVDGASAREHESGVEADRS